MSSKSLCEIIAIKRVVFQILLVLLLRMIAGVADGDLNVLIILRSPERLGFGAIWTALPAAWRKAEEETVAESWALAAAEEAEAHTKEEKACADSAERGEGDATQQSKAYSLIQLSRFSSLRICQVFFRFGQVFFRFVQRVCQILLLLS